MRHVLITALGVVLVTCGVAYGEHSTEHGTKEIKGLNKNVDPDAKDETFRRLFQKRPLPQQPSDQTLIELGKSGGVIDEGADDAAGDNPTLPAGFIFFGQFVDHDVTLDETSSLELKNNPKKIINVRTPNLELDSVYGAGPSKQPELYDQNEHGKLKIGNTTNANDLPRNAGNVAFIGDPRNDENLIISQLHLAFLKFHNKVVDHAKQSGTAEADLFNRAQHLAQWHYQWIVVHDFLPRIMAQEVIDDILKNGPKYYKVPGGKSPFIPVEFAVAAYRFGHSLIRSNFRINDNLQQVPLFSDTLTGFHAVPPSHNVDWKNFFDLEPATPPQGSRKLDTKLATVLFNLPFLPPAEQNRSLATRNLLRGRTFELPSGQTVAQRVKAPALNDDQIGLDDGLKSNTPLWFYILKEAEVQQGGARLGAVGGRLVGEVLLGVLKADPKSYLNSNPSWKPTLPAASAGAFTMVDLIKFSQP